MTQTSGLSRVPVGPTYCRAPTLRVSYDPWLAIPSFRMSDPLNLANLAAAERVLAGLSLEDRDELLESLVIAAYAEPETVRQVLRCYIIEHDFQELVQTLDSSGPSEGGH